MQTFAQKWAPQTLAEVVYAEAELEQYVNAYAKGGVSDHLLLYGTNGVGKTETVRLLPEAVRANAPHIEPLVTTFDIPYKDDAIIKAIDNMCHLVKITQDNVNFVVFNEVDNLSSMVLDNLKSILDGEHPVRLLMTTNKLWKINDGIKDRAEMFCVACPNPQQFLARAKLILNAELVGYKMPSDDTILAVMNHAYVTVGSGRSMLRALERLVLFVQGKITVKPQHKAWVP